jgi:hypothetical protein
MLTKNEQLYDKNMQIRVNEIQGRHLFGKTKPAGRSTTSQRVYDQEKNSQLHQKLQVR